jgi:hypothetical protein
MPHVFASLALANLAPFAFSTAFALSSVASARDRHILLAVFSLLRSSRSCRSAPYGYRRTGGGNGSFEAQDR